MGKFARSARGVVVDFDLLEITQSLKNVPPPVSVNQRRQFINEKDGISQKAAAKLYGTSVPSAMELAVSAAQDSIAEEDDSE